MTQDTRRPFEAITRNSQMPGALEAIASNFALLLSAYSNSVEPRDATARIWIDTATGLLKFRVTDGGEWLALPLAELGTFTSPTIEGNPVGLAYPITGSIGQASLSGTTDQAITVTVPAHFVVLGVRVKTSEAFAGGGVATLTLKVALGVAPIIDSSPYDLMAAVGNTNIAFGDNGNAFFYGLSDAPYNVTFTFTPDGGANMTGLTAGSVDYAIVGIRLF